MPRTTLEQQTEVEYEGAARSKLVRLAELRRERDAQERAKDLSWVPVGRAPLEPHQIAPSGAWSMWLLEGGRGCGKTEACSRYFASYMRRHPGHRGRIIAPTFGDAVEACIEGPSGLRSIDPEVNWLPSSPGGAKVVWPNGSEALVLGTPAPRDVDRLRAGGNRHIDWWEEMAANPQLRKAWDQAAFGLRLGDHPHSIASTTPRGIKDYRELRSSAGVAMTHATLFDNPHNPAEWVAMMRARYQGTTLGQQELMGLVLDDVPGALWQRPLFDLHRVADAPHLDRVVIAIDPAVTSGDKADDTGIIVAGSAHVDGNLHGYLLADRTCHLSPDAWARRAIDAYHAHDGDLIVGEVNNGGELVASVLKTQDDRVPFKSLHASRGKRTRAEPVVSLYEQGRIHHVGGFAELEDECCTWVPGEGDSPDRLDAAVWALTELLLNGGTATMSVPQGEIPRPDRADLRPAAGAKDWQLRHAARQLKR